MAPTFVAVLLIFASVPGAEAAMAIGDVSTVGSSGPAWKLCRYDTTAWCSATSGGTFDSVKACASIGCSKPDAWGGCSQCSCTPTPEAYNNGGGSSPSSLSLTVHWRCTSCTGQKTKSATPTPSLSPSATRTASVSWSRTVSRSLSASVTRSRSGTNTRTSTLTTLRTLTQSVSVTSSLSFLSPTATVTATAARTATATLSTSATRTTTETRTRTLSLTVTRSDTNSVTRTPTVTATVTKPATAPPTLTPTATLSRTVTATTTQTASQSSTVTPSATPQVTPSPTATKSRSLSPTASGTETVTLPASTSATNTDSHTRSATGTKTETSTRTLTPTAQRTASDSGTATLSASLTPTVVLRPEVCGPGLALCPAPAGFACADLERQPEHCGHCGHDCGQTPGATCLGAECLAPTPTERAVAGAAQATAVIGSAAAPAAAAAGSSMFGVLIHLLGQVQFMALFANLRCLPERYRLFSNSFGWSFLDFFKRPPSADLAEPFVGRVLTNLVMLGVIGAVALVLRIIVYICRPPPSQAFVPTDDAFVARQVVTVPQQSRFKKALRIHCSFAFHRTPTALLLVLLLTQRGIVQGAARTVAVLPEPAGFAALFSLLFFLFAFPTVLFLWLRRKLPPDTKYFNWRDTTPLPSQDSPKPPVVVPRWDRILRRPLSFHKWGKWQIPLDFPSVFGMLFLDEHSYGVGFQVWENWHACVLAAISGARTTSIDQCHAQVIAMAIFSVAFFCFFLWRRPLIANGENVIRLLILGQEALVLGLMAFATVTSASSTGALANVLIGCTLGATLLIVIKTLRVLVKFGNAVRRAWRQRRQQTKCDVGTELQTKLLREPGQ